jgi:cysteinyl-tRNA synthetase
MEEELAAGKRMPIGGGVVVDRRRFAEMIDELRRAIPASIRHAREVLEREEESLSEARQEADRITAVAEREAATRISQTEVLRRAHEEAEHVRAAAAAAADETMRTARQQAEILTSAAEREAAQQRDEADRYAIALLSQLQRTLGAFLGNVRESLDSFAPADDNAPQDR